MINELIKVTSTEVGSVKIRDHAVVVGWLLNVPTTCYCISGMDLLRELYMLLL